MGGWLPFEISTAWRAPARSVRSGWRWSSASTTSTSRSRSGCRRAHAGFLAINPNGRLPAIVDGGFVLVESLAITLYLAKKHGNGTLYPATIQDEAKAWQWSLWALTEVDRGVNIWSLHAVRLPPAERNAAKLAEALQVIAAPFKVLDEAVAKQPYLLGNDFTVADLNVAAVISRAIEMDLSATPQPVGLAAALPGTACRAQGSCAQGAVRRRNIVRGDAGNRQAQPAMSGPVCVARRLHPADRGRDQPAPAGPAGRGGEALPPRAQARSRTISTRCICSACSITSAVKRARPTA